MQFSNQSVMKAVEKFVEAVQEMDETILVPSRLMDLQVEDGGDTLGLKGTDRNLDLYSLYSLVNCVQNELLWGTEEGRTLAVIDDEEMPPPATSTIPAKTHVRRPSTVSMTSTNSAGSLISDTDSETGNENDSGIEGESEISAKPCYTKKVEASFRRHLYGLHRALEQMTDAASFLTKRYQNDIGGAV